MREATWERQFNKWLMQNYTCVVNKVTKSNITGSPDLIIFLATQKAYLTLLIECKKPGKKAEPHQTACHEMLNPVLAIPVQVLTSLKKAKQYIRNVIALVELDLL